MRTSLIKKWVVLVISALTVGVLSIAPIIAKAAIPPQVLACDQLSCLKPIAVGVYQILEKVNSLPEALEKLVSVDLIDVTPPVNIGIVKRPAGADYITTELLANFATLGNTIINENLPNPQVEALQSDYLKDFFGIDPSTAKETLPYVNDMIYQTLLGKLWVDPDPREKSNPRPNPARNYLRNVSSLAIAHIPPGSNWQGTKENQIRYFYYYNTISSIQTFNAYVATQLLTQTDTFTKTQTDLIKLVNDKNNWVKHVATEQIGKVFRQILMFDSQNFILLTQMLETQKKLLTAQTMTNSLLVLSNLQNEDLLVKKATGVIK